MISYKDNHDLLDICKLTPVIPVLVVDDTAKAAPLAKALIGGGLRVLEVTLRTENALDVIKEMAASTTEGIIGAGTLLSKEDVYAAKEGEIISIKDPNHCKAILLNRQVMENHVN